MRKILTIFISIAILSFILPLAPEGLDAVWFGFLPVIFIYLLMPFVGGILSVLVQDKNKSYEFLPGLLLASCLNGFGIVLITFLAEYSSHAYLYQNPLNMRGALEMVFPLIVIGLFGGLIGLVIRGITLLAAKNGAEKIAYTKRTKISLFILTGLIFVFAIGVMIPKLTVRDTVSVDDNFRGKVMQSLYIHYDNPLERLALRLGKSRIVSAEPLYAEVESFTLFRIPFGFFHGIPDMKVGIFFNPAGDWSAKIKSDVVGF